MRELDNFRKFLNEGVSKEGLISQIKDIKDALENEEINGEPLTNETEQDLQQELKRLELQLSSIADQIAMDVEMRDKKDRRAGINEELTITGEYQGEPVVNSGVDLEEYLIDIMSQAIGAVDFVRKVSYGMTDETSSLSKEDQEKLIQFYTDNIQHFDKMGYNPIGKTEKSSEPSDSDFNRLVDELEKNNIPSNVILGVDGRIDVELGRDYPDRLAGEVFNILDNTGIKADVSADVTTQEAKNKRTNGGPRRDWVRDDEEEMDFEDLWESHLNKNNINEDNFSREKMVSTDFVEDWDYEGSIKKIIDELKEYQKVNPQDDLQKAINHLEYLIYT